MDWIGPRFLRRHRCLAGRSRCHMGSQKKWRAFTCRDGNMGVHLQKWMGFHMVSPFSPGVWMSLNELNMVQMVQQLPFLCSKHAVSTVKRVNTKGWCQPKWSRLGFGWGRSVCTICTELYRFHDNITKKSGVWLILFRVISFQKAGILCGSMRHSKALYSHDLFQVEDEYEIINANALW